MPEWRSIAVYPATKTKVDHIKKATGKSYDTIINDLLINSGIEVDDVVTIERDKVAVSLKFFYNDEPEVKIKDVTFQMLREAPVGAVFIAEPSARGVDYMNSWCELVFKRDEDVILLCTERYCDEDGLIQDNTSVVHIKYF